MKADYRGAILKQVAETVLRYLGPGKAGSSHQKRTPLLRSSRAGRLVETGVRRIPIEKRR